MKKLLTMLLAGALVLSLASCGGETAPEETEEETAQPTTESEEPAAEAEATGDAVPEEDGGTLIAYFSWSGNTEQVAQLIQEATGGDLFEIAPPSLHRRLRRTAGHRPAGAVRRCPPGPGKPGRELGPLRHRLCGLSQLVETTPLWRCTPSWSPTTGRARR